jgi:hypothetical protein
MVKKGKYRPGWSAQGAGVFREFWYLTEVGQAGWRVKHCGHPTALRPWAVHDLQGRLHVNPVTGLAFTHVLTAQLYVEQLYALPKMPMLEINRNRGGYYYRAHLEQTTR